MDVPIWARALTGAAVLPVPLLPVPLLPVPLVTTVAGPARNRRGRRPAAVREG
ncbi:MAG: hypothetical protein JWO98_1116 [Frankiales bacterium]|jgi:hypothetical protein|nr:hypothetical protein [Frankiales bacterium]